MVDNKKEYLYLMGYISKSGHFIGKIGTSNDPYRRVKEHNRAYRKTPNYPLADGEEVKIFWMLPLSWLNTLRYEKENKDRWIVEGYNYIKNDRFVFDEMPHELTIKIKKEYTITLE